MSKNSKKLVLTNADQQKLQAIVSKKEGNVDFLEYLVGGMAMQSTNSFYNVFAESTHPHTIKR